MDVKKTVTLTEAQITDALASYISKQIGEKIEGEIHIVFKNGEVIEDHLFTKADVSW